MPESARWLIANGKLEQAQMYLKNCANMNRIEESIHTLEIEVCKLQMVKSREPSRVHYGVIIGTNYTQRRWTKALKNTVYSCLNVIVGFVLIFTALLQMEACPQMALNSFRHYPPLLRRRNEIEPTLTSTWFGHLRWGNWPCVLVYHGLHSQGFTVYWILCINCKPTDCSLTSRFLLRP